MPNSSWRERGRHFGARWHNRVALWWRDYRWPVIGVLWIVAWSLGYIGFARDAARASDGEPWTVLSTIYAAAQLFTMESGSALGNGALSWQLEVARWMAPLVAAFTAAEALAVIFYAHLQRLRLRRIRDHIVICGLGQKGLLLVKEFRERGDKVVVVEQDEGNDSIASCQEQGAIVCIGNATEPEMLCRARVQTAKYLISVCGDDGANAEVAAHACDLVRGVREDVLTCSAHITDPALWYLLRKWEINTVDMFRLQFFNVFDAGARALLETHPPFNGWHVPRAGGQRPHLLVVGVGRLGQSLVLHAARHWRGSRGDGGERLRVTLIDKDTERIMAWLALRHPELEQVCAITAHTMDVTSPEFHRAAFLQASPDGDAITAIYVCLNHDALSLSSALALFHQTKNRRVPIVARMSEDAGLATLLHSVGEPGRGFEGLHAFGLLERTCQPELVLGGTIEMLARAIHDKYVREQEACGHTAQTNRALVIWEALPEEIKESNRSEADHIGFKLRIVGCDVAPLTDWNAASFTFTPEEVELMARMEHERWLTERGAAGWLYGPRDAGQKTNPHMVEWKALPETARDSNRNSMRNLPDFLARASFQIYRLNDVEAPFAESTT